MNKVFLQERLEKHKHCYEIAIDADDMEEIKRQAAEMKAIKEQIKWLEGVEK